MSVVGTIVDAGKLGSVASAVLRERHSMHFVARRKERMLSKLNGISTFLWVSDEHPHDKRGSDRRKIFGQWRRSLGGRNVEQSRNLWRRQNELAWRAKAGWVFGRRAPEKKSGTKVVWL